jgi:hypothetical protein
MNIRTLAIRKEPVLTLALLTGIALAAPVIFKQQYITGPIVNATLILGAALLGGRDALLIGLVPSTLALGAGIISPALAPMIPFIILGNAILVLTFAYLSRVNYWLGVVAGSLLKFIFLYATSTVVIRLLMNEQAALAVTRTMNWPQLFTALAGGVLAFAILKIVRGKNKVTG